MHKSLFSINLLLLLLIAALGLVHANILRTCQSCEGVKCQRTSYNQTVQCIDLLDYCVTIYDDRAQVLYKGCSLDIPTQLRQHCEPQNPRSAAACHKCNTDRCNNVGTITFSCLQCDSSMNGDCAKNPHNLSAKRCEAPTAPNSYCYVRSSGKSVTRGCAINISEQQKCLLESSCLLCSPGDIRNCNNVDVAALRTTPAWSFLK